MPLYDTKTAAHAKLTYNEVVAAGPPARPLEFPAPTVHRGARVPVNVFDKKTREIRMVKNVIVRARDMATNPDQQPEISRAYCIRRKISDAIYGSVRLCVVLKRQETVHPDEMSASVSSGGSRLDCSCDDDWERDSGTDFDAGSEVWEVTDEIVVVKVSSWAKMRNLRGRHLEDPIKEVAALQLLGNYHPNIMGSIEVLQDDRYLYSVMRYCSGGDLYGEVMNNLEPSDTVRLNESRARIWFRQLLSGLEHLQKKGACHRDLSLENIMVHGDNLVIIDMGMCVRIPYSDPSNQGFTADVSAGTVRRLIQAQGQGGKWKYMAPEVLAREDFDGFAIDLWAAAVILYIMIVGLAPFKWAHESDKRFEKFSKGKLMGMMKYWKIPISDEAGDLLQNMFWRDPSKRLTLAQVMLHPWVVDRGDDEIPEELKTEQGKKLIWI